MRHTAEQLRKAYEMKSNKTDALRDAVEIAIKHAPENMLEEYRRVSRHSFAATDATRETMLNIAFQQLADTINASPHEYQRAVDREIEKLLGTAREKIPVYDVDVGYSVYI